MALLKDFTTGVSRLPYRALGASVDLASTLMTPFGYRVEKPASEYLRSLGIPGIKYFDGGSRAAGEGTRNFVIFDPDVAKILKRE